MTENYYVYILSDKDSDIFYIGVTNDLVRRVGEHRQKIVEGFTKRYNLTKLLYYEVLDNPEMAIAREKQLKAWKRDWKIDLIVNLNPSCDDLYEKIL